MAMKQWFRRLQPLQLYALLVLSVGFLLVQLVMSHTTHALTLLMESYHMLCNIIALVGCIISIKYGSANMGSEEAPRHAPDSDDMSASTSCYFGPTTVATAASYNKCTHDRQSQQQGTCSKERRLKNTFGWARIDVLVMLSGCVFLASLCFSVLIEALQTLVHIKHQDEMHHPIPVMCVGAVGLLLNGLCYLLIGGYTFHQGSFLHVTSNGDIVLDHKISQKTEGRAPQSFPAPVAPQTHQGILEICRDVLGCVIVILCAVVVYTIEEDYGKFVDPVLSIVSAILLFALSYPFLKESGYILLQTIPDSINIDSLRTDLLKAFPDIINVHDLHVWRLTATKVFSTAHIIFLNAKDYIRITKDVTEFFHDQGITQVTIQPEFFKMDNHSNLTPLPNEHLCLVPCRAPQCVNLHCCLNTEDLTVVTVAKNEHNHLKKLRKQDQANAVPEPVPHICQLPAVTCVHQRGTNSLSTTSIKQNQNTPHTQEQVKEKEVYKCQSQGEHSSEFLEDQHKYLEQTQKSSEFLQGELSTLSLNAKENGGVPFVNQKDNVQTKHNDSVNQLCNVNSANDDRKYANAHRPKILTDTQKNKQNSSQVSSHNTLQTEECSKTDAVLVTRL